jgi:hypothetical protein
MQIKISIENSLLSKLPYETIHVRKEKKCSTTFNRNGTVIIFMYSQYRIRAMESNATFNNISVILSYLLTLPLFAGVSRVRALSPAWTGSHA